MAKGKRTAAKEITRKERRIKALDYRKRGMSIRDIAKRLGVSVGTAHNDIDGALTDLASRTDNKARELRAMEAERLLFAMESISDQVEEGDVRAVEQWRRLSESFRKLYGLDAPLEQNINLGLSAEERQRRIDDLLGFSVVPEGDPDDDSSA